MCDTVVVAVDNTIFFVLLLLLCGVHEGVSNEAAAENKPTHANTHLTKRGHLVQMRGVCACVCAQQGHDKLRCVCVCGVQEED